MWIKKCSLIISAITYLNLISAISYALPSDVQNVVNILEKQSATSKITFETSDFDDERFLLALNCDNESENSANLIKDLNNQIISKFREMVKSDKKSNSYELIEQGFKPKLCTTIDGSLYSLFITYLELSGKENDYQGNVKFLSLNIAKYMETLKSYEMMNQTDLGYVIYSDSFIPDAKFPGQKKGEFKHTAKIQENSILNMLGVEGDSELIRARLTFVKPRSN